MKEKIIENIEEIEDLEIIFYSEIDIENWISEFFAYELSGGEIDFYEVGYSYFQLVKDARHVVFGLSQAVRQDRNGRLYEPFLLQGLKNVDQFSADMKKFFETKKTQRELEFFLVLNEWVKYYLDLLAKNENTKKIIEDWFQNQKSLSKN